MLVKEKVYKAFIMLILGKKKFQCGAHLWPIDHNASCRKG